MSYFTIQFSPASCYFLRNVFLVKYETKHDTSTYNLQLNNLLTPFPCAENSFSFGQNNPWLYVIICYKRHLKWITSHATAHINYPLSEFMIVHVYKHALSSLSKFVSEFISSSVTTGVKVHIQFNTH
jgi:hypothetical protein